MKKLYDSRFHPRFTHRLCAGSHARSKGLRFPVPRELVFNLLCPVGLEESVIQFQCAGSQPWLIALRETTTDLDFYELCVEYVASLNDTARRVPCPPISSPDSGLPPTFMTGVTDRFDQPHLLPLATYPFGIGDELVYVDGVYVGQLLQDFSKYAPQGNWSRLAASPPRVLPPVRNRSCPCKRPRRQRR
jgi:hypothetical protein